MQMLFQTLELGIQELIFKISIHTLFKGQASMPSEVNEVTS